MEVLLNSSNESTKWIDMHDILAILFLSVSQFLILVFVRLDNVSTILQVQTWDINPTTVYGVLFSVLVTAIVVLWRSNREKDKEIKELNRTLRDEIKSLRN